MVETTIRFKYPATLEEVTTKQYMRWVEVLDVMFKEGDDKINMNELTRQKISIFCNIPLSAVDMIPVTDILDVSEHITKLLEKDKELVTAFFMGDTELRIVPNFEDIKLGEFADGSDFLKDPNMYHRLLAVFYREVDEVKFNDFPGIEQYRLKPYDSDKAREYAEKFLEIPATVIVGLTFFLLSSFEALQNHMRDYLEEERMIIVTQSGDQDSVASGDGFTVSID